MRSTPAANRIRSTVAALVLLLLVAACSLSPGSSTEADIPGETFPVNSLFVGYYESLGGYPILGPAITPLVLQEHLQMQYTESALLVYDPLANPNFSLAPLGIDLGYGGSEAINPGDANPIFPDRYPVFGGFLDLYNQLGGEAVVGPALGDADLNTEKNRIEQHFANLGFYQSLDDPERKTYLLAYGVLACSSECGYSPLDSAIIDTGIHLPEPFAGAAVSLGAAFTGNTLAGPHIASDGNLEVIFDNLVMYADPDDSSRVIIRPIVEAIGFQPHPLSERLNTDKIVFFIVKDGLGYNIPVTFNDYLADYGNLSISGPPISELFQLEEGLFRQCFANMCLDYFINNPAEDRVKPAPLGAIYKAYTLPSEDSAQGLHVPDIPGDYQLRVTETSPYITSQQEQSILVNVFQGNAPAVGVETVLSITLPDGSVVKYRLQPTDQYGATSITIPPITASNGEMIYYEVCVGDGSLSVCVQDNYLIWGNP